MRFLTQVTALRQQATTTTASATPLSVEITASDIGPPQSSNETGQRSSSSGIGSELASLCAGSSHTGVIYVPSRVGPYPLGFLAEFLWHVLSPRLTSQVGSAMGTAKPHPGTRHRSNSRLRSSMLLQPQRLPRRRQCTGASTRTRQAPSRARLRAPTTMTTTWT